MLTMRPWPAPSCSSCSIRIRAASGDICCSRTIPPVPPSRSRFSMRRLCAGSRVTPEMWEDKVLGPNPGGWGFFLKDKVNDDGYQSICTPGMVRGLAGDSRAVVHVEMGRPDRSGQ